ELEHDVTILDEPLPTVDQLETVVREMHLAAKLPMPKPERIVQAATVLSGLSRFAAEQATALSLTETGLDIDSLTLRSHASINQVPGLHVWTGTERFDDLVGLEAIKTKLRSRMKGKRQ